MRHRRCRNLNHGALSCVVAAHFPSRGSEKGSAGEREGQHRLAGHLACLEAVETLVVGISWGTFAKPRPFWWDLVASLNCRIVHPPELVRGICGCFLGLMVYLDPDQLVGSLHQMVGPGRKCLCFPLFPGSSPSFAEVPGSPLRCVCAQVVKD